MAGSLRVSSDGKPNPSREFALSLAAMASVTPTPAFTLVLPGRVLFLSTRADTVAAQFAGHHLSLASAGRLRQPLLPWRWRRSRI